MGRQQAGIGGDHQRGHRYRKIDGRTATLHGSGERAALLRGVFPWMPAAAGEIVLAFPLFLHPLKDVRIKSAGQGRLCPARFAYHADALQAFGRRIRRHQLQAWPVAALQMLKIARMHPLHPGKIVNVSMFAYGDDSGNHQRLPAICAAWMLHHIQIRVGTASLFGFFVQFRPLLYGLEAPAPGAEIPFRKAHIGYAHALPHIQITGGHAKIIHLQGAFKALVVYLFNLFGPVLRRGGHQRLPGKINHCAGAVLINQLRCADSMLRFAQTFPPVFCIQRHTISPPRSRRFPEW